MENTPNAGEGQGTGNTNADRDASTNAEKNKGGRPRNSCGQGWSGNALKVRRILAGWRVDDLAQRLGVSKSTVSRWETGTHAPPAVQIEHLAALLDTPRAAFAREPKVT